MKYLAALLFCLSANAQTNDAMRTVMTCRPPILRPDVGMSVTVSQGGFAGISQIEVSQFFLGHSHVDTYYVQLIQFPNHFGAPVEYSGNGVRLTANFTTAPSADGSHTGYLTLNEGTDQATTEELSCKLNK